MIFATFAGSGSIPRCHGNVRLQAGRVPAAVRAPAAAAARPERSRALPAAPPHGAPAVPVPPAQVSAAPRALRAARAGGDAVSPAGWGAQGGRCARTRRYGGVCTPRQDMVSPDPVCKTGRLEGA